MKLYNYLQTFLERDIPVDLDKPSTPAGVVPKAVKLKINSRPIVRAALKIDDFSPRRVMDKNNNIMFAIKMSPKVAEVMAERIYDIGKDEIMPLVKTMNAKRESRSQLNPDYVKKSIEQELNKLSTFFIVDTAEIGIDDTTGKVSISDAAGMAASSPSYRPPSGGRGGRK